MSEEFIPGVEVEMSPIKGLTMNFSDYKDLKEGDSVVLFLVRDHQFSVIRGKYKIEGTAHKKFHLVLMEEKLDDEKDRKQLAKIIVKMNSKMLKDQALKSVEVALSRKPKKKLEALIQQSNKGKKAQIESRKGCMFLQIGSEDTIL